MKILIPTRQRVKEFFFALKNRFMAFFKHPYFIAFLCGAILVSALPPYHFLPALFVCFTVITILLAKVRNKKQAFLLGFSFGFAHFAFGLAWVSNALLVDDYFAWMAPFPPLGFGLWGGFFPAFCFL